MGRKPLVVGAKVDAEDLVQASRRVLLGAVGKKTLEAYQGKIGILGRAFAGYDGTQFQEVKVGLPEAPEIPVTLKKSHWFKFCEDFAQRSASTAGLEAYRAAVAFFQQLGDVGDTWASDPDVSRAIRAARFAGGEAKRPRGAITTTLFADLLKWLEKSGESRFKDLVTVLFGTHCRIEEIMRLTKGDVILEKGIMIPNKACRASLLATESPRVLKAWGVMTEEAIAIIRTRVADRMGEDALLFPCREGRAYQLRAVMKRAAEELGWEKGALDLSVPHCLRHGRIVELYSEGRGNEVKMSENVLKRYSKPNEERVEEMEDFN
jgi:integrase